MPIEYLSHTADIRMVITADLPEDLFLYSLKGMGQILKENMDELEIDDIEKVRVELEAIDTTNLLIDFLSEVLSYSYVNNMVYHQMTCSELTQTKIVALVWGSKIDRFDEEIKAVTYHEAEVVKTDTGQWTVNIVFDI